MNYNKLTKAQLINLAKELESDVDFLNLQVTSLNKQYLDEKENARIFKDKLRLKEESLNLYMKKSMWDRIKLAIKKERIQNFFFF